MSTTTRNNRQTLIGVVTSRTGDKSVKVTIPFKIPHPRYKKVINRKSVVHVHDEKNETHVGDKIEIMSTRPLSRLKRFRVLRIVTLSADVEVAAARAAAGIKEDDVVPATSVEGVEGEPKEV
ncbi:MAG: 30S ribosomal protein S17 [Opitutaceae bacterium]|jgi:small subunit ribosomal protein S17|nr:30S ribosomal protein S17 [Opitutaceae bacterium]